jgi:Proprotein convertase P-domain
MSGVTLLSTGHTRATRIPNQRSGERGRGLLALGVFLASALVAVIAVPVTAVAAETTNYSSGNIAVAIPDASTAQSTISVPDGGAVFGIDVRIRLNHTFDEDLAIYLIAPDGTTVELATNVGGSGANFGSGATGCGGTFTVFNDSVPAIIPAFSAPFAGTFRPEGALSAFHGRGINGIWTLRIRDDAAEDTGTLFCWQMSIRHGANPGSLISSRSDPNVWRPSNGQWFARNLEGDLNFTLTGQAGDIPVSGDYDGNGFDSRVVWRPSTGQWIGSLPGAPVQWGLNGDVPVPGDYNGDGVTDLAVWRPSDGVWYVRNIAFVGWGLPGDIAVPGDYNGDGRTDFAVWRPSSGVWFARTLEGEIVITVGWGINGDIPVPGDYDANGRTELAVWRPSEGVWYIRGTVAVQFGVNGDIPGLKRPAYPGYPY